MTAPQPKPRALVVGSTFGLHYVRALAHPDSPIDLVGLVGRGSERSRKMAADFGVPFYALPDRPTAAESLRDANLPDVDLACVVVRSAVSGGPGDDLAKAFIEGGTTVVQEHPCHITSVIEHLFQARNAQANPRLAERGFTAPFYALNSFYVNLPTVQNFLNCVGKVREQSAVKAVEVRGSIHVFYPILDIIAHIMPGALPRLILQQDIKVVQHPAHPEVVNVSINWAGTPVDIRLYNRVAPLDPDNHAQPLFACVVETEDGELSLDHVHGPTRWQPRSHYVNGGLTLDPTQLTSQVVGDPAWAGEFSGEQILHDLWPTGLQRFLAKVAAATTQEEAFGQKDLGAVKLWQEVAKQLPSPVPIDSVPPREIHF